MNKIAIFSVPRSGSTWLGQIFNSSPHVAYRFQPNFAYSFPGNLSENSSIEEIDDFYTRLLETDDPFVNAAISISGKKNLEFVKENIEALVFKETHYLHVIENLILNSDTKVIGLIRSPFATINSWLNTPKEFSPEWNVRDEWINAQSKNREQKENFFGYEKWKDVTNLFLRLADDYPKRFLCVSYESMLAATIEEVKVLFGFCDILFTEQTEKFIVQAATNNDIDPYSVFRQKSRDDKWKKELPDFIQEEIMRDEDFVRLNRIFKWV